MLSPNSLFSKDYNDSLLYRERIKSLVLMAKEKLRGGTLYGRKINTENAEELVAALYILYSDYDQFHERM